MRAVRLKRRSVSRTNVMEMSLTNCWDCPLTVVALVSQIILLAAAGFVAVWLLHRRTAVLQAFGAISLIVASFFVLTLPVYVPRWGVWRIGSEGDVYPEMLVRGSLVGFAAGFLIGAFILLRRSRPRAV